jgi:hypothetical protein
LTAVNRVAEFPTAYRLEAVFFVRSILAQAPAQTGAAVAARRDSAGDDPLPFAKAYNGGTEFLDDAHRLMPIVSPAATGYSPLRIWMSVPHIVVVVTRTSASSGPISGIGFSSSTIRPGLTKTAAFIFGILAFLILRRECRHVSIALVTPACRET